LRLFNFNKVQKAARKFLFLQRAAWSKSDRQETDTKRLGFYFLGRHLGSVLDYVLDWSRRNPSPLAPAPMRSQKVTGAF